MLTLRWNATPTISFLIALAAASCDPGAAFDAPGGGPGGGSGDGEQCEGPLGPPRDPENYPACCQDYLGNAHCLGADIVPPQFQPYASPCEGGGFCVPDKFIATGGVYTPPSCTSLDGAPGVCLSVCIPDVAKYYAILPQDVCDPDERCAPCVSPIDGSETGACLIKGECVDPNAAPPDPGEGDGDDPTTCVHEGSPVINPSALPACAPDAHCLRNDLVPPEFANRLASCPDGQSKCVPDLFLTTGGKFIPATCRSMLDAEGRCLSRALPDVKAQEAMLPQSTCTADERCVPCYSPLDGSDTGACALSCDTGPVEPKKTLPSCCEGRATCVPTGLVPSEMQSNLEEDTCEDVQPDAYLCVPNEFLQPSYTPPACTAQSFILGNYSGVCLSDCLDFGLQGVALARGSCASGNKCAPCVNPLTGEPTGAPGCP